MNIMSLTYIGFLLVTLLVYRLIPQRARKIWLFLCSILFCGLVLPLQTLGMLLYAWIVLVLGKLLGRHKSKALLAFGVILSIGLLYFFKYLNFTMSVIGIDRTFKIIAPIGISYIVFQCIAYLTEVYREKITPVSEPMDLFIYMFFFPKVLSGPIEPPERFIPQLYVPVKNTYKDYLVSFSYIVNGFVRKMVVADFLAVGVDAVYASPDKADRFSLIFAAVMYSFQIYFDFSGYTDIAIGSAGMFGIRLTQNFNRPYLATGIRDFWKRWHISLSTWLRNYIYIPLGGNRKGFARKQLNTFITFAVSGLWHGASLTYVLWGAFHGLMQVIENLFDRKKMKEDNLFIKGIKVLITFVLVTIAWIFFRIPGIGDLKTFGHSFIHNTPDLTAAVKLCCMTVSAGVIVSLGFFFSELTRLFCMKKGRTLATLFICLLDVFLIIASIGFFPGNTAESSFIYFNF